MRPILKIAEVLALVMIPFGRVAVPATAQTPPSRTEIAAYTGLHEAAHEGNVGAIRNLVAEGADLEAQDGAGRTPLHVAAFASQDEAVRALAQAGADLNALENRAYDIVTIAAVADDLGLLDVALSLGADAGNVTSPYDGTALIAAAHLGHHEVVKRLIAAGAPLDHVNNLGWTALMEAVVLGDGGAGPRRNGASAGRGRGRPRHCGPAGRHSARPCSGARLRRHRSDTRKDAVGP